MAIIYYFSLFLILQIINTIFCSNEINQRTTNRCDQICDDKELKLLKSLKPDCQRGCRFFNIEFLTSAGDIDKVTDLNSTQDQCKITCNDSYFQKIKRDACHLGCSKMYEIQAKAPYIHGWLVYMGASDGSMILMQPDLDLPAEDNWILLDAIFRPRDYDDSMSDPYKLTETKRVQTMPIYPRHKNLSMELCIPTWMWMVPFLLFICLIWMHYGNTIHKLLISDDCDDDKKDSEDFIVALDSYFYPTPAIPPPKYNAAAEEILMSSDDENDQILKKTLA